MHAQQPRLKVGQIIRQLRKSNQLTLKQLAAGCGLSSNAISLVERGAVAPTLSTLCKIAQALGVSASSFFQDLCPSEVQIVRAGSTTSNVYSTINALSGQTVSSMPFISENSSNICGQASAQTQTALCVCGHIEYEINERCYQLAPGDQLTFPAAAVHRWRNPGSESGVAVLILPPSES